MAVFLRIFIGLVFSVSGLEKLISPYQNFLYAIQAYAMLPSGAEKLVALLFPWGELIVGLFLILGLWIEISLKAALVMFGAFVIIVGQALIRRLPLDSCGCFGESIHISPNMIIVFDSFMLLAVYWLLRNPSKVSQWSLDKKAFS